MSVLDKFLKPKVVEAIESTKNPCRCAECAKTVQHWFCSSCGKGPYAFVKQRFLGSRFIRNEKGVVESVRYWCSRTCRVSEERTHLMAQLAVARTQGDLRLCHVLTGQLQQLGQPQVPDATGVTEQTVSELVLGTSDVVPD